MCDLLGKQADCVCWRGGRAKVCVGGGGGCLSTACPVTVCICVGVYVCVCVCTTGETEEQYRHQLGSFGVSGELAMRPVVSLSGGQKSRVAFALMAMTR